jgi:hypothetical protein
MNYTKYTDRLDIHINDASKIITIRQRWDFRWKIRRGAKPWIEDEKKMFKEQGISLITSIWEDAPKVNVRGNSVFAKQNISTEYKFRFDIQQALSIPLISSAHWVVDVYKHPNNKTATSKVHWYTGSVILDINDIGGVQKAPGLTNSFQYPITHEFGHMIGNIPAIYPGSHGDEYKINDVRAVMGGYHKNISTYVDYDSIMNVGSSLRERHFDYLLRELNTMIPGTTFYFNPLALWR